MKSYTIDLSSASTLYELHAQLKDIFSLPEYYGMNMDALWDCLYCAFPDPALIELRGREQVPASLRPSVEILQELLLDLARQDPMIEVSFL